MTGQSVHSQVSSIINELDSNDIMRPDSLTSRNGHLIIRYDIERLTKGLDLSSNFAKLWTIGHARESMDRLFPNATVHKILAGKRKSVRVYFDFVEAARSRTKIRIMTLCKETNEFTEVYV